MSTDPPGKPIDIGTQAAASASPTTAPPNPADGAAASPSQVPGKSAATPLQSEDEGLQKVIASVTAGLDSGDASKSSIIIQNLTVRNEYTQGNSTTYDVNAGRDAAFRIADEKGRQATEDATASEQRFAGDLVSWWESGEPSQGDLCRLIAIATLEGTSYKVISRHASELQASIVQTKTIVETPEKRVGTVGRVLVRLGAYRAWQDGEGTNEQGRREAVFFEQKEWRAHCLVAAWQDLEILGASIATWLISLAANSGPSTRGALQTAIAKLFVHDPDGVFFGVILPLSRGSVAERWIAANALAEASSDAAPKVLAKLRAASHLSYGQGAASVSALCVANAFGKRWPGEAADLLLILLEHWRNVDAALGVAMDGLVRQALTNADAASTILTRLAGWSHWKELSIFDDEEAPVPHAVRRLLDDPVHVMTKADAMRHFRRLTSQGTAVEQPDEEKIETAKFIAVVAAAILDTSEDDRPDNKRGRRDAQLELPIMVFATKSDPVATAASELLLRLLRFSPAKQTTWSLIREMLRWVNLEKATGAIAVLRGFVKDATPREKTRLRDHLERWQRDSAIRKTISAISNPLSPT